jgi:very-short-patch-repair endonuclease
MTEAERRLWSALRGRRLRGFKFRRQQPLGIYIIDFFCPEARLIVEADGSQHDDEDQAWYDYGRTKWLKSRGYHVLRFRNYNILRYPSQVVEAIADALGQAPIRPAGSADAAPSVHLPPQGGKGKG